MAVEQAYIRGKRWGKALKALENEKAGKTESTYLFKAKYRGV
jgi:hypothetical protein